jgi:hypothetical protein
MVEAQIPCLLGGMNTIIHVGDMIMYAKFSQFSYYRKDDEDIDHQNEYKELIEEGIGLQEVKREDLPTSIQDLDLWDNSDGSGFLAKIYKDELGRYVVAFRGTVTDNADLTMKDIKANAEQGLHLESEQYNKAMKLSKTVDEKLPNEEVIFVGHSKGGGEAAAGGTITGKPTYTYNSAGLSEETVSRYGKDNGGGYSLKDSKHIIALNATTDILSMAQDGKFFIAGALSQIPIIGPLLAVPVAQMPQAAGKRTSLMTDKTFNPLANHGLEPLIRALQKKAENPAINVIAKDFEKL